MKIDNAFQRVFLCLFFLVALAPATGWAQQEQTPRTTVAGIVRTTKGDALSNVSVTVRNSHTNFSAGTQTDSNGVFHFAGLESGTGYDFTFSSIGFETQTFGNNTLKGGAVFSLVVKMNEAQKALSDVIVIGYGTQRKTSTTAAVSTVKGSELVNSPVPNITAALAGRVSGISARPNGGVPGQDNPDIHIRGISTIGSNSGALVVIDGVIRGNINEIDPNSIESVSILKDAAAVAPYGLGGANGVILITTKRGKSGTANLSLGSYYGFQRPTFPPHMLNARDYMTLKNEADVNSGLQPEFSTTLISGYDRLHAQNPDAYPNSDAQHELVRLNTPQQNYNVQVAGGSDKVQYYVGLNYLGQQGNADPLHYNRYSYNVALDINATATTKISASLSGAEEQNQIYPSVAGSFLSYIPTNAVYFTNGLWGQNGGYSPAGALKSGSYNRINTSTLLSSLAVEQQLPFIKGLSIKGVFSYDPVSSMGKNWNRPVYYYIYDSTAHPAYNRTLLSDGYTTLTESYTKNQNFTYQGYLNYHGSFGEHSITGLLVAEARNNIGNSFYASRKGFSVDLDQLSLGTSDRANFDNGGTGNTGSQVGYVYRLDYSYANKYLFEATGRYDGHYYFAPGKRWSYFPAFSAGWRLSEEPFIKNNYAWINNLKLRGSWGKSGNLAGTAFQYLPSYTLFGNAYAFGNDNLVQGSFVPLEANPNITWEKSTKTDIGLEGTLWKGLLNFEADYFYEKRSDMLLPPAITVPVEYGIPLADENAGVMSNKGFELSLGTAHTFRNGLQLGANGNFSYAKNKLLQVFETAATRTNPNRSRTGKSLNTPFGYQSLGLFHTGDDKNGDGIINSQDGYNVTQFGTLHPGDVKYADLNGDGKIDASDETVVGYPEYPRITYGLTLTGNWKGFDVNLFFQGSAQASLNIQGYQTVPFRLNNTNTSYEYFNNRWTPDHQDAKYPRAYASKNTNNTTNTINGDGFGRFSSSQWMVNTGFMRLKTGVIGYTIPPAFTRRYKIQTLRFYVSGQNLFTVSKLRFMDPETGYSNREEAYPVQKAIIFGLNMNF